jgi:hypothetical protein
MELVKAVRFHMAVGLVLFLSAMVACGNDGGVKSDTSDKSAPAKVTGPALSVTTTSSPEGNEEDKKDKKIHGKVPIGAVIDWWRPDPSFQVPDGYQICDGSVVQDSKSPFDGHVLPDLTDRFVMGITNPDLIGEAGGSSSHRHQVDVDHQHNAGVTGAGDSHNHRWLETETTPGGNLNFVSYNSGGSVELVGVLDDDEGVDKDGGWATWFFGRSSNLYYTNYSGSHDHDLNVPGLGSHVKDCTLETSIPPFYGLLKIMRVR